MNARLLCMTATSTALVASVVDLVRLRINKRTLTLLSLVLAVSVAVPAAAAPSVDRVAGANASFTLVGAGDVSFKIDIAARLSELGASQGTGRIEVLVRRCVAATCNSGDQFAARLKASEFNVQDDLSAGALQTQLFGYPLTVQFNATDAQVSADGKAELYQPVLPGGQVRIWARQTKETKAQGRIVGRGCASSASYVYRDEIVDGVILNLPKSLPTRVPPALSGLRSARCT